MAKRNVFPAPYDPRDSVDAHMAFQKQTGRTCDYRGFAVVRQERMDEYARHDRERQPPIRQTSARYKQHAARALTDLLRWYHEAPATALYLSISKVQDLPSRQAPALRRYERQLTESLTHTITSHVPGAFWAICLRRNHDVTLGPVEP